MLPLLEGILVAAIWASSFVFIKLGLVYMGPLTLAGLRYSLAAIVLLPWVLRERATIASLTRSQWLRLALLGLCAYTIANGAFNWGLRYLACHNDVIHDEFEPTADLYCLPGVA